MTMTAVSQTIDTPEIEAPTAFDFFHNALRIMFNIDADEFSKHVSPDVDEWKSFRDSPFRYFVRTDDASANKLWGVITARSTRYPTGAALLLQQKRAEGFANMTWRPIGRIENPKAVLATRLRIGADEIKLFAFQIDTEHQDIDGYRQYFADRAWSEPRLRGAFQEFGRARMVEIGGMPYVIFGCPVYE